MLNKNSKIKDLLKTPIGKDVVDKVLLQMNKSSVWIENPLILNLKLKHLNRFIKDEGFVDALINLANQDKIFPTQEGGMLVKTWWKEIVFYQIYPKSFKDSNGDGKGDLQGILSKLDYIESMGFGGIWLSPIFKSPMKDNGYDISDYYAINPEMGTMDDLKQLIEACHQRGLKIILDLVVNHTSDQHPWFMEALNNPTSDKRDYYFFRDKDKTNNWVSFFYESAWKYFEAQDISALHLFASEQFDLNWDNQQVRDEVVRIINFYADLGIDGYRLDVINYISKNPGLPEGNPWVGELIGFTGIEHYFYGPHLHDYLQEINERAFKPNQLFSIGETPGIGIETSKMLSADYRHELDLIFNFDHLENPGKVRFDQYFYDLEYYKKYMIKWQKSLSNHDWMSLFFENHDNPRMISKVSDQAHFYPAIGKLIGVLLLTLKGTPFIYQGQEAGFINQFFLEEELRDVESINKLKQSDLETVNAGTRDQSRAVMKWNHEGGFTEGVPWIKSQHPEVVSIEEQLLDPHSILCFYKTLIELRNNNHDLIYSPVEFEFEYRHKYFGYRRGDYFIEMNLTSEPIRFEPVKNKGIKLLSNYLGDQEYLRPYEAIIYRKEQIL